MARIPWKKPEREKLAIQTLQWGDCFFILGLFFVGLDNAVAGAGVLTGLLSVLIVFGIAIYDEIA